MDYFDKVQVQELEKNPPSTSQILLYKNIRLVSANGELIEHRFKVFVESIPVVSYSLSNNNVTRKDVVADNFVVEEEVVDTSEDDEKWRRSVDEEIHRNTMTLSLSKMLSSNPNPMCIYKIVENIAQYLSLKDLLTLRLTCKEWNYALIPQVKKKCNKTLQLNNGNLNDFISTMSRVAKTQHMPIFKYNISGDSLQQHELNTLFNFYGHFMTHLNLNIPDLSTPFTSSMFRTMLNTFIKLIELCVFDQRNLDWNNLPVFQPFWNEWTIPTQGNDDNVSLPLLNKLHKIRFNLFGFNQGRESEAFLTDFFNSTPNLENLEINRKEEGELIDYNSCTMIGLKGTKTYLDKLKILHFKQFRFQDLNILIDLSNNCGLRLTELNVDLLNPETEHNVNLFPEFLKLQTNSLKLLSITTEPEDSEQIVQIPSMKLLEKLEVNYYLNGFTLYTSLSGETRFPELKTLEYRNNSFDDDDTITWDEDDEVEGRNKWDFFVYSLCSVPTLTNLTLDFGLNSLVQMTKLGVLFPNIIKLNIYLKDVELIRKIWTQWPNLKVLKITSSVAHTESDDENDDDENKVDDGLLDEVITGIPTKFHAFLNMFSPAKPLEILNTLKTQPGVFDMKYLTELELDLDKFPRFISDISAYYGFGLPDTQITLIDIPTTAHKISRKCLEDIKGSMRADAKMKLNNK